MKKRNCIVIGFLCCMLGTGMTAGAEEIILAEAVGASSSLKSSIGISYEPENIQDFNTDTCWSEGVPGNGIGEYLVLEIPAGTLLTGGVIYDGYQKSVDTFQRNPAPAALRISTGGDERFLDLKEVVNTYYGSEGGGYDFKFDQPLCSDGYVMIEIEDVRGGYAYEDTSISELYFTGVDTVKETVETDHYIGDAEEAGFTVAQISDLQGMAMSIYMGYNGYADYSSGAKVTGEMLNAGQQAYVLYGYQFHADDDRIERNVSYQGQDGYNAASEQDLKDILSELFGDQAKADAFDAFCSAYEKGRENDMIYMDCAGDFGGASVYYFDYPGIVLTDTVEGQTTVTIIGDVREWNYESAVFESAGNYSAKFVVNRSGNGQDTFTFKELYTGVGG